MAQYRCVSDSTANALELRLSCTTYDQYHLHVNEALNSPITCDYVIIGLGLRIPDTQIIWMLERDILMSRSASHLCTSRSRQNDRPLADDTLKRIFGNENVIISIKMSLKFVPEGQIHNIAAFVQIMTWCLVGAKPLSELMVIRLPTHICVGWP